MAWLVVQLWSLLAQRSCEVQVALASDSETESSGLSDRVTGHIMLTVGSPSSDELAKLAELVRRADFCSTIAARTRSGAANRGN